MTNDKSITPEQIKEMVHKFFIERFVSTMDVDFNDMTLRTDELPELIVDAASTLQGIREEWAVGVTPQDFTTYLDQWTRTYAPSVKIDNQHNEAIKELFYRADIQIVEIFLRCLQTGYAGLKIDDPYFSDLQSRIAQPVGMLNASIAGHAATRRSIEEAGNEFISTQGPLHKKTIDSNYDSLKIMLELLPDVTTLDAIDEDAGLRLLELLQKRPSNISKLRANNISTEGRKTLSSKTISKHFAFYKQFFNWCVKKKYLALNPMAAIRIAKPKASQGDREPFSQDQIKALFSSPMFTGFRSRRRRADAGKFMIKDVDYWCTILCYYTGSRPGEILPLRLDDIQTENDILYVNIVSNEPDKSLKTASSRRRVPLHSDVLALGFMDHLKSCKDKGSDRLFDEAKASKATGLLTDVFSKRINNYMKNIGVKRANQPFYSLRHTFSQALREAGIPEHVANELMGHANKTMSYGVYGGKMSMKALKDAVEAAQFPVNVYSLISEATRDKELKHVS